MKGDEKDAEVDFIYNNISMVFDMIITAIYYNFLGLKEEVFDISIFHGIINHK
jgi:hypothetical protein